MTGTGVVELLSVAFGRGKGNISVRVSGNGPPVLYLHSEIGLTWDNLLADLARTTRSTHPSSPAQPRATQTPSTSTTTCSTLSSRTRRSCGPSDSKGLVVVGHSFGGMLAAELAAVFPDLFSCVVLIDAFGLWSNDYPTSSDLMAGPYERLPEVLFHDPHCPAAQSMQIPSVDAADALDRAAACIWAVGCAAKFLWPIPERGLAKRLHRITAPTLILWGAQDAVVSACYAFLFADHIAESRMQIIDNCGHIPQLEQEVQTISAVREFLAKTVRVPNSRKREAEMNNPNGVHHLARSSTTRMRDQLEFFTDVLGAELKALYWMHGFERTFHGFVKLNDFCSIAFVQGPKVSDAPPNRNAGGAMQHVAFNVKSYDDLLGMRDRIRDRGLNVFGPVDHGFCKSIYFAGLEGMMLEIATSEVALDERAWIDPEVVELVGIDAEMLERLKSPASFESQGGAIVNPPVDWSRPQIPYMSKEEVEELMSKPDAQVMAEMAQPDPPVKVDPRRGARSRDGSPSHTGDPSELRQGAICSRLRRQPHSLERGLCRQRGFDRFGLPSDQTRRVGV